MGRDDRDDIEDSLARLENLGARNHYEYAFLGLARYSHAQLYGTEPEQIRHLRQALSISSSPEDPIYLGDELVRELRRALLPLQLRSNYFPEAIETFGLMEDGGDDEGAANFRDVIETVKAIRLDDTEYLMPLSINESGSRSLQLFKHNFALTGGEGRLVEVVLRCEMKYVAFQVERDVSYDVPPEWGDCSIQIVGDAGAEFFLLQH